ncbi:hypothetical protein [Kitasatospora sp. McL0602]|uniref:hypothetical protein n=1 Tax=Kitasatospora sp. McL0602 TaxID=3439530 RepID=UPI003F8BDE60
MEPAVTARTNVLTRAALAATALLTLLTGCSATAAPSAPPSSAAPGSLTVQGARSHLELSGGVLHRDASGAAELTLTVRNAGTVPEHLSLVSTPADGRATLQGSAGPDNALSTAGVLIRPGESAVFGGQGPTIKFPAHSGASAAPGTVDTILIFSVSGIVHLPTPTQ